jgi:hypothetical protein
MLQACDTVQELLPQTMESSSEIKIQQNDGLTQKSPAG